MYLQLHLHKRKLLPIGEMSVAYCNINRGDNIHQDSLAQWHFRLYKLHSPSVNLLGYTKLLNLTACFHNNMSLVGCLHGCYPQPTTWDPLKCDKTHASRVQ